MESNYYNALEHANVKKYEFSPNVAITEYFKSYFSVEASMLIFSLNLCCSYFTKLCGTFKSS